MIPRHINGVKGFVVALAQLGKLVVQTHDSHPVVLGQLLGNGIGGPVGVGMGITFDAKLEGVEAIAQCGGGKIHDLDCQLPGPADWKSLLPPVLLISLVSLITISCDRALHIS